MSDQDNKNFVKKMYHSFFDRPKIKFGSKKEDKEPNKEEINKEEFKEERKTEPEYSYKEYLPLLIRDSKKNIWLPSKKEAEYIESEDAKLESDLAELKYKFEYNLTLDGGKDRVAEVMAKILNEDEKLTEILEKEFLTMFKEHDFYGYLLTDENIKSHDLEKLHSEAFKKCKSCKMITHMVDDKMYTFFKKLKDEDCGSAMLESLL